MLASFGPGFRPVSSTALENAADGTSPKVLKSSEILRNFSESAQMAIDRQITALLLLEIFAPTARIAYCCAKAHGYR